MTPSGTTINGLGIEPDVMVRNSDARLRYGGAGGTVTIAEDRQLEHALKSLGYDAIALSQAE
jgi:C-terminal processing protease CtpA/Prc